MLLWKLEGFGESLKRLPKKMGGGALEFVYWLKSRVHKCWLVEGKESVNADVLEGISSASVLCWKRCSSIFGLQSEHTAEQTCSNKHRFDFFRVKIDFGADVVNYIKFGSVSTKFAFEPLYELIQWHCKY